MMVLANLEPATHASTSQELGHKRSRSEDCSDGMDQESIPFISGDSGVEGRDKDLDDKTLISRMVSSVAGDAVRQPWSVEDIENILASVKPGSYEISMRSFERLAKQVSRHLRFRC